MPGGMQAGMPPRIIDMRILGCMHPGMPGVIKCQPVCRVKMTPAHISMPGPGDMLPSVTLYTVIGM